MKFDNDRKGTGTKEWAEVTENIQIGCANGCLYCYAADKAAKMYGGWCKREDWTTEKLTKRAEMKSYPARDGVIMFPSTHDITLFNLVHFTRVARLILAKGNSLLIVTKPRWECIPLLCNDLMDYRDQILFRFTIGTLDSMTSEQWEPFAPQPVERLACLAHAYYKHFQTSVSIEPMLSGRADVKEVVASVDRWVSDTIWIGKMNKPHLRVPKGNEALVKDITEKQRDSAILALHDDLKGNPKIRWKDSIKEVVARYA